jgi:hypothetical protein
MKKIGHPRIFKTPEDLYKAFQEYKDSLEEKAKDWPKIQYVGKDGERRIDYPQLPLTIEGFKVFCYDRYGTVEQYLRNQDGLYHEYIEVCTRIREEVRNNQITGGLLGVYNPSITQRLNNLKEVSEVTQNVNLPSWMKKP